MGLMQNDMAKTQSKKPIKLIGLKGEYNIKGDKILPTCFATDFFLKEADEWRKVAWAMITFKFYLSTAGDSEHA